MHTLSYDVGSGRRTRFFVMHILLFVVVSLLLYFVADWLLKEVERRRGAPFDNRTLIFFAILLVLALVSFNALNYFLATPPGTTLPTPHDTTPR